MGSPWMRKSQEFSNEFREGNRTNTSASDKASEEVVKVVKVDRRGVGVDGIASSITSILHHGPKKKRALGGAFVEQEKVQKRGLSRLKFEEVG